MEPFQIIGTDAVGNPIVQGCPFPSWCPFAPGETHRHSLILHEDRRAVVGALDMRNRVVWPPERFGERRP